MGFPVFFDTCVLYGELVNDLILRLAEERMFVPYWSQDVLDELEGNLAQRVGDERAATRLAAMTGAFPDALVTGYERAIDDMTCDPKDRHVLAAACHSPADTLVTFNLKDFPPESIRPVDISTKHPDDFMLDVLDLDPGRVTRTCFAALSSYHAYPQTPEDYCTMLVKSGLSGFANQVYPALDALYC